MADACDLPAGEFSAWLRGMERALRGEADSVVPCGTCTACCTSSQFVHIGPDETDALARIPGELLFPAPGLPSGHVLMGYDERGHCPMLREGACTIYEHRPRTCRTYDCRVFPASGVELDEESKAGIASQARRWRFSAPTDDDRIEHEAVEAAAEYVREHRDDLPAEIRPSNATQVAVLAVEAHKAFVDPESASAGEGVAHPTLGAVTAVVLSRRRPDFS